MSEHLIKGFTVSELEACARREVGQRKRVYRRLVGEGKMSGAEADLEIAKMRAIAEHFEEMKEPKLF
jgi:hypothetical protein